MENGAITEYIDVAQVTLYVFWIFFAGLIIYLRREDTREGYPLETDVGGAVRRPNFVFFPKAKKYALPDGEPAYYAPNSDRDTRPIKAERMAPWPGSALNPSGENPLEDAIGPGAYAERAKVVEKTIHGEDLVAPLRVATDFDVQRPSRDPRGMPVIGADGEKAGEVVDIWVDRAEALIRHLEVRIGEGPTILLPMAFARLELDRSRITVRALHAHQFSGVPKLPDPDRITRYDEEVIQAYWGGGYFYADAKRPEPLV